MTPEEGYLFDLQGYIVVENALSQEQLLALNTILDARIAEMDDPAFETHRFGDLLKWGKSYLDLVDHEPCLSHLEAIFGASYRLDHVYLDVIRSGLSPIGATLHGGGTPHNPSMFYHYQDGCMFNGLTVVAFNLHDVNPGEGGFACVPGSHKSNIQIPHEWRDLTTPHDCVTRVHGKAGTAVIFTEALTHGPLPWTADHERRTLFYKYNNHAMSWAQSYLLAEDYEGVTERQAQILHAPASTKYYD